MDNYFLWIVVPTFGWFLTGLSILLGIFFFVGTVCQALLYAECSELSCDKEKLEYMNHFKMGLIFLCLSILLGFLGCIIPSKKEMIQLQAASIITQLKGVEQIPQKLVDKLNILLEQDS